VPPRLHPETRGGGVCCCIHPGAYIEPEGRRGGCSVPSVAAGLACESAFSVFLHTLIINKLAVFTGSGIQKQDVQTDKNNVKNKGKEGGKVCV